MKNLILEKLMKVTSFANYKFRIPEIIVGPSYSYEKKLPVNKRTEVKKSKIGGMGLFATTKILKGQIIGKFKGKETKKDHIHVLWFKTKNYGLRVTNNMKFANHSWKNPNSKIKKLVLRAIKDIEQGEEILWDYSVGYTYSKDVNELPKLDNHGHGVIHYSIINDNFELFKKALEVKSNRLLKTTDGWTPIDLCIEWDMDDWAIYCCTAYPEDFKDYDFV